MDKIYDWELQEQLIRQENRVKYFGSIGELELAFTCLQLTGDYEAYETYYNKNIEKLIRDQFRFIQDNAFEHIYNESYIDSRVIDIQEIIDLKPTKELKETIEIQRKQLNRYGYYKENLTLEQVEYIRNNDFDKLELFTDYLD